jgi:hypothetical protein
METIFSVYQITTTVIAIYGYYKLADTGYHHYNKAKMFINGFSYLVTKIKGEHQTGTEIETPNRIFFSKPPFEEHWEILYEDEIKYEIEYENKFYFPNVVNFISYTYKNESGEEVLITEL